MESSDPRASCCFSHFAAFSNGLLCEERPGYPVNYTGEQRKKLLKVCLLVCVFLRYSVSCRGVKTPSGKYYIIVV